MSPMAHSATSSIDSSSSYLEDYETNPRKRVGKACDACRIKKTKCDGHKPCTRCLHDNKICTYANRAKKSEPKTYPPGYVELIEDRVILLQKALREFVRRLALNEDLSFIVPAARHTTKSGYVIGKFSVNLILDKMGIKVRDDDDPINNLDVLKNEIIIHKPASSDSSISDDSPVSDVESTGNTHTIPKLKRGRPPKKRNLSKISKPEKNQPSQSATLASKLPLKTSVSDKSSHSKPHTRQQSLSNVIDPEVQRSYILSPSSNGPSFSDCASSQVKTPAILSPEQAVAKSKSLAYKKALAQDQAQDNQDAENWEAIDYYRNSISGSTSSSADEEDMFGSSASASPCSASHWPQSFPDSVQDWETPQAMEGGLSMIFPTLDNEPAFTSPPSSDTSIVGSSVPTTSVLESMVVHDSPFLGVSDKSLTIHLQSKPGLQKDSTSLEFSSGLLPYADIIVDNDFSSNGIF